MPRSITLRPGRPPDARWCGADSPAAAATLATCTQRSTTPYIWRMNAIHLTDTEIEMARHALQAYLQTFGHDEADTVKEIRRVIAKLQAAEREDDDRAMPA